MKKALVKSGKPTNLKHLQTHHLQQHTQLVLDYLKVFKLLLFMNVFRTGQNVQNIIKAHYVMKYNNN